MRSVFTSILRCTFEQLAGSDHGLDARAPEGKPGPANEMIGKGQQQQAWEGWDARDS